MKENNEQGELIPPGRRIGTKAEYARHRGCRPSAVHKAIAARRISTITVNGKELIDFQQADSQWSISTRPRVDSPGPPPPRGPLLDPDQGANMDALARARLVREEAAGQLLALKLDVAAGLLLERASVERVIADAGATLRSALEELPARVASELVDQPLPEISRLLADASARILGTFCEQLARFADGTDAPGLGVLDLAPDLDRADE